MAHAFQGTTNDPPDAKRRRTSAATLVLRDGVSARIELLYPRVRCHDDIAGIKGDMADLGFAVIESILTADEVEAFQAAFWRAVTSRCPSLKRDDRSTWTSENCEWKGTFGAGQYKHYGMAQEEHCWLIRRNPTIRRVFEEAVYGEECCVSIDGAAAMFGPSQSRLPLHVDLCHGLDGFDHASVQGSYNVFEVFIDHTQRKAGAGFVCVPGSHQQFASIAEARRAQPGYKPPKKHFAPLEADSPLQQQAKLVVSPANCLIIWDSRLLHRNYGGDWTAAELGRVCRLTQFVCWNPKRNRSEKVRQKKLQNVLEGKCGNHWPGLGFTEPIKPFPPWGKHTITTLVPFEGRTAAMLPSDVVDLL